MPIVMAKKALKDSNSEEQIKIITDNQTSYKNLMSFFKDNKINAEPKNEGDFYSIIVSRGEDFSSHKPAEEYCNSDNDIVIEDCAIVVKSRKMGDGDELLGIMLLEAFINNLPEQDLLPKTLVFYNDGIRLLTDDSKVIKALNDLLEKGTKIIACGTCVDYYELKEKINIGTITNMHHITETLLKASKVIYP